MNRVVYLLQFRTKPLTKNFGDIIIKRLTSGEPLKEGVRILDIYYLNGFYDVFIKFSAPDHITAKRYYETIRAIYKDYFLDDPLLLKINFPLIKRGKLNPELEKLYDFMPKIED